MPRHESTVQIFSADPMTTVLLLLSMHFLSELWNISQMLKASTYDFPLGDIHRWVLLEFSKMPSLLIFWDSKLSKEFLGLCDLCSYGSMHKRTTPPELLSLNDQRII